MSSLLVCYLEKGLDNHCKFSRDGTKARIAQLRCWNTFFMCFMSFFFLTTLLPFAFIKLVWGYGSRDL